MGSELSVTSLRKENVHDTWWISILCHPPGVYSPKGPPPPQNWVWGGTEKSDLVSVLHKLTVLRDANYSDVLAFLLRVWGGR